MSSEQLVAHAPLLGSPTTCAPTLLLQKKLKKGQYASIQELSADVMLMINNAFSFHAPGTLVYSFAADLQERYQKEILPAVSLPCPRSGRALAVLPS